MPAAERTLSVLVLNVSLALAVAFSAGASPAIEGEPEHLDLGRVREGVVAKGAFTVRNTGDEPLVIERIQTSCTCAIVKQLTADEHTIPPQTERKLHIAYDTTGRHGISKASVFVTSNDPDTPVLLLDMELTISAPVLVKPPAVRWGRAIRGMSLQSELRLSAGQTGQDIDLIELRVQNPHIKSAIGELSEEGEKVLRVRFTLDSDTPLEPIETQIDATVRIEGQEHTVHVPMGGLVLGDVICSPPLVAALRVPVYPGARISAFTVKPSRPEGSIDVVKTEVAGPLRTEIVREGNASLVEIYAKDNAPAGPHGCLVEIYTTSLDQPVIKAPVYVLMAGPVATTPDHVVLRATSGGPSQAQEVTVRAIQSLRMRVVNATPESDSLDVETVVREQTDPEHPAIVRIGLASGTALDVPMATAVILETDQPGAEAVRIPVLIRPEAATKMP